MSKLIYIVSTGHSGSTLLDILLGTFPGVFSTGEFRYFTWQLFRTRNGQGSVKGEDICTCGKRFQECVVWAEIIRKINNDNNIDIFKDPLLFNTSILTDFKYNGKTSWINKIISKLITFEMFFLPFRLFSTLFKRAYRQEVKNVWKLIDALGEITGAEYVVDSTKGLLRYYLLKLYRPDDVLLIVNNRDSIGYANSYLKRNIPPKVSLKSQKQYILKTKRLLRNLRPDHFMTQYEDFVKEPEVALKEVGNWLGLNYSSSQINNLDTRNYHLVAGNPMRYKGKIKIKYDEDYKIAMNEEMKNDILYYMDKYKL